MLVCDRCQTGGAEANVWWGTGEAIFFGEHKLVEDVGHDLCKQCRESLAAHIRAFLEPFPQLSGLVAESADIETRLTDAMRAALMLIRLKKPYGPIRLDACIEERTPEAVPAIVFDIYWGKVHCVARQAGELLPAIKSLGPEKINDRS